ncbi:hypothetical protein Tco_1542927 [Tanacetum coccineum]
MVQLIMNLSNLPLSFLGYALESATHILNRVPTKKVSKTPYELWHGKALRLSYLKVWGCVALVKQDTPIKLESRTRCVFVGYLKETSGYYFYYMLENKEFVSRNVEFLEEDYLLQEASGGYEKLDLNQETN